MAQASKLMLNLQEFTMLLKNKISYQGQNRKTICLREFLVSFEGAKGNRNGECFTYYRVL